MCNWNQHLVLLIQVDLVQRDFLTDTNEIPNTHFHNLCKHTSIENWVNLDLQNEARRGPEGRHK